MPERQRDWERRADADGFGLHQLHVVVCSERLVEREHERFAIVESIRVAECERGRELVALRVRVPVRVGAAEWDRRVWLEVP